MRPTLSISPLAPVALTASGPIPRGIPRVAWAGRVPSCLRPPTARELRQMIRHALVQSTPFNFHKLFRGRLDISPVTGEMGQRCNFRAFPDLDAVCMFWMTGRSNRRTKSASKAPKPPRFPRAPAYPPAIINLEQHDASRRAFMVFAFTKLRRCRFRPASASLS